MKQIKTLIVKLADSQIVAHYNFMVGYPIEEMNDLMETIDLIDYIRKFDPKAQISGLHIVTPYPGTDFYHSIVKNYNFKSPATIEEWANIRWESANICWSSPKMQGIYRNISLISYFIDDKILRRTKDKIFLKVIVKILMRIANWRWKRRNFLFCPECNFANKIINYKISIDK